MYTNKNKIIQLEHRKIKKPYNKQGRLQHTPVQVNGTGVWSKMHTTLLQVITAELYVKNRISNSPDN